MSAIGHLFYRKLSALSVAVSIGLIAQPVFASNAQVELVPYDTAFYFGTGRPVAVDDFFALLPDIFSEETLSEFLPETENLESQKKFLQQIADFFENPTEYTDHWGLGDELQFSAYSVGLLPVLRIAADGKKFESAISRLETESDIKFQKISHKGMDVRVIAQEDKPSSEPKINEPSASEIKLAEDTVAAVLKNSEIAEEELEVANAKLAAAKEANDASGIASAANDIADAANKVSELQKQRSEVESKLAGLKQLQLNAESLKGSGDVAGPGLIVASDGTDIIVALTYDASDSELLDQLLGTVKPEQNLAATGKLKDIRKDWNYGDEMALFVDFGLLAESFTGGDTEAARQLNKLKSSDDDMAADLDQLAQEPCKSEIRQMAAHWPMAVSGNRRFDVSEDSVRVDSHFAMVVEHELLRETLQLMRGVVPASQSVSEAMMSMGFGLDVDSLPNLSAKVTELVGQLDYGCEVFTGLNELAASDTSSMSLGAMMVSGVARGLKGFSFNLYDTEIDSGSSSTPVKSVDAAIAVAAEDPAGLLQAMRLLPQLSILSDLPTDGTAMSLNDRLPVPVPDGIELFAAVKGKNVVVYSGEQATDFANRMGGSGKEGLLFTTINTAKILDKLSSVVDSLPAELSDNENLDSAIQLMEGYPRGSISYKIDFTNRGVEIESASDIKRAEK